MADRRDNNPSMRRRGRPKLESGTCNVCSAPCSSCMHRNTNSKSDESSDENSHGVVASQCSFNGDDLLRSSGVNALGSSRNTASEASNLVNSIHDTSSDNAKSKKTIRAFDITNSAIIDGSRKDQDSMKVDLCNDHQATNILGQGTVKEKSGADNREDTKNILIESSTHSIQSEMVGKSGENVLSNKAEESNASDMSESESADSEMLELDVKVCDICGDAGREDLLAICSKCSDGAEHTYCMRVMLKKVPKGDWLCEECKFAEEAEKKKQEIKGKRESEVKLNTGSSSKRHMDKFEAAPDSKRLAVEAPTGSPKRSVFPKLSALSQGTSFKGIEKPLRKLGHHSSFNSHSSDDTESTRSADSQLQSPKGSFFKSNSFNSSTSRSKVRPVDDVILPRQKTGKVNASLDVKEGFSRNVGKPVSSRCIDAGSSSCNDSIKVKGSKQLTDQSTEANPSASTVDQKLISRGNTSTSYANGSRDLKGLQPDDKQVSLTKQARHLSRNRLEDIVASVGDTSSNEKCSSSEQISSEKCKDELANVDGLPRSREFGEAGEKSKDAVGNSQTRSIREDINKGNRLRAAVDAALRKKPSFSKNRGLEQSDLPSASNVDSGGDKAIKKLPSKVPVIRDWPVGFQGLPGGPPNLRTDKQTIAVSEKQFTPAASQSVEPEVHFPSVKPVMRDLPVAATTALSITSAIPEHEYIWQGDMEVQKSGNLSATHSGMQAYLSTLASPKVVEVVNQIPVKVTLNEVPRLSTWPRQFQDAGAREHDVALFFFAKDIESYEKNYKPLVDNMIQKDLALKGNLDGIELLIFASNQLPQNCQRWNMLFFLWGVFRGRKDSCSNPLKNKSLPASCVLPNMAKELSTSEAFRHEKLSIRESLTDDTPSRMQSCMKEENAKEDKPCGTIEKEKAFSVSNGDNGAVEETEEGEIDVYPQSKGEKMSGPRTLSTSNMNQKRDLDELNNEGLCEGPENKKLKTETAVEAECSISRSVTSGNESASWKSGGHPCEEEKIIKKNPTAAERIVFPLDLNDGKGDDDEEMVDDDPGPLGNDNNKQSLLGLVPNLELALGEEKITPAMTMTTSTSTGVVLPFTTRITSMEEHRNSSSYKPQEEMVTQDDAASLSLSLSFSSLDKDQQQQQQQQQNQRSVSGWEPKRQNVNTLFLFRDFPDNSS